MADRIAVCISKRVYGSASPTLAGRPRKCRRGTQPASSQQVGRSRDGAAGPAGSIVNARRDRRSGGAEGFVVVGRFSRGVRTTGTSAFIGAVKTGLHPSYGRASTVESRISALLSLWRHIGSASTRVHSLPRSQNGPWAGLQRTCGIHPHGGFRRHSIRAIGGAPNRPTVLFDNRKTLSARPKYWSSILCGN
ncbi:MAG: hypothetical protein ACI8TQ_003279 [Planctomycetota bacterium]|jgi:hypothetical protein